MEKMPQQQINEIKVWDPLIRLFHWLLVIACFTAYFTQEEEYELHLLAGYTVLGLICFRILWGFVGPRYARFRDFIFSPTLVVRYLKEMINGHPRRYLGHNPAGGAMIIALLFALLATTLSGIALDAAENRSGPLADTRLFLYTDIIAVIHRLFTHIATVLVPLHLLGVLLSSWWHKENLARAMFNGSKKGDT